MDTTRCGLGVQEPVFHPPSDLLGIQEDFYNRGIAFLDGFDEDSLSQLASKFGDVIRPRNEKTSGTGISNIRFAPSLAGKGYSSEELYFHTDRSGWDRPPRILVSTLQSKSKDGGASMLADSARILKEVKEQRDGLYELLTSSEHSSFRADNGVFVPRAIFDKGLGLFRFRFDDSIQLSASLVTRFSQFFDTIYRNSFAVNLQKGQGYLLNNHRFLHGRTSFIGSRELLRALVDLPPPKSVVTILFDIDGTLCHSEDLSVDAYYSCLSEIVGKSITHENTTVSLHGRTDLGLLHDVLDHHNVDFKDLVIKRFLQLHPKYLQRSLDKGFLSVPCQGVLDTLEWVMAKKTKLGSPMLRVGLLTGNSCPNALLKLRAAGIDTEIFDLSISSFGDTHVDRISLIHDSMAKLRARDGPDLHESKVIIVGDTPLDIECAKQAGCAVVAVASGNYNVDDLALLKPDHACAQLDESKDYLDSHLEPSPPMVDA
ncbi:HAD-like domain-containing protein [Aspergillus karnatakaensis]|uniref:HAD-like domain-containing protein n=1 Tax=Aspergillus karnatakaensis TaxID=1810916 RepID=UPI003CCD7B40